ncbi:MAG: hypothetical protein LC624_12070 [Halobacteriales archaeon]|nr:hypothetical protein [Halobacteriales archaeon]
MSMLRTAPWAFAGILLLTALPAQANFHGVPWTATGIATDGDALFLIDVTWGGGLVFNTFHIVVREATGAVVRDVECTGQERWIEVQPVTFGSGGVEVLYMFSGCADPGSAFSISGVQVASLNLERLHQDLTGTFEGLSFVVTTPMQAYHVP